MTKISVVSPFYNERDNLPLFKERCLAALQQIGADAELVLVDDHSTDGGGEIVESWAAGDSRITYIRLSRNCGTHAACSVGLVYCTGDCAVLMASDLQDPPESIPSLVERWRSGNDVVWAARAQRPGESWSTKILAQAYYELMRRFALPEMPQKGADFLLIDRKVIDAYNAIPEKNTSILGMILWLGFRQTVVEYVKQERQFGESKWSLSKKLKLFVDSFVSFSYAPIRLMSVAGMAVGVIGLIYAMVVVVNYIFHGVPVQGWSSLIVVILLLGGFQLLMLGVLGEYLWRAFDETRGRPRYVIEKCCRMEELSNGMARESRSQQKATSGTDPTVGNRPAGAERALARAGQSES